MGDAPPVGEGDFTMGAFRAWMDALSDHAEDWQGIPVIVPGQPLTLNDRHPMAGIFAELDRMNADDTPTEFVCGADDVQEAERVVNTWFSRKANADVLLVERGDGTRFALTIPRSPDQAMDRLALWLQTLGASDAWDLDAEHTAREKLRGLISERAWRHYDLTGAFLETSERSRLTYLFRRLRPTVVLTSRNRSGHDNMRCLAVLCMHPIGYYQRSWAGCLTPTDDVIAHLTFMRGDEAGFWRQANQHESWRPEAGL